LLLQKLPDYVDLEGLAQHRSSLFGAIHKSPRTQKDFEALLVQKLKTLLSALPVFVVAVEITPETLYPGSEVKLKWTISGKTSKINSFAIYLEGIERAEYRRGTNIASATNIFERLTLFSTDGNFIEEYGNTTFTIPENTMHSFTSAHNSIKWYITVHGDIKRWPDILQKFPVKIRPNQIVTIEEED